MTIGLAMIVKDGAETMEEAITPFWGVVDKISIVLGGPSSDDTPAIATRLGDVVSEYAIPPGGKFHFGQARQQSFDQLDTDWVVVVDVDDRWQGTGFLKEFIAEADERNGDIIYVLYKISDSQFYQPRVYRNGSGAWRGAVHEVYKVPSGTKVVKTSEMIVSQLDDDHRTERTQQNIELGLWMLEQDSDDLRVISHLIKDYLACKDLAKATAMCDLYMEKRGHKPDGEYDTEYFGVLQAQAEIYLHANDYDKAAFVALKMLQVRGSAVGWAVLAEATHKMAHGSHGLLELSIYAADQALFSGKPRNGQLHYEALNGSVPCLIKAMALHDLGLDKSALHMADLGRMIDPYNPQLETIQKQLAFRLNEAA